MRASGLPPHGWTLESGSPRHIGQLADISPEPLLSGTAASSAVAVLVPSASWVPTSATSSRGESEGAHRGSSGSARAGRGGVLEAAPIDSVEGPEPTSSTQA